jgi:PAS domain-containing protein
MAALTVIGCSIGNAFERERIETRRRKSERKFRRLIEQASDGILVNNSDGTFVEVNEAACKMTGYDRQELLALTPKQLLTPESLAERPFDWDSLRRETFVATSASSGARMPQRLRPNSASQRMTTVSSRRSFATSPIA